MFQPYSGQWTFDEAAHLLRRTIFGPTKARILQAVADGMETTISTLLSPPPIVDPPIYYDYDGDPEAGIGETWVDKEFDGSIPDNCIPSNEFDTLLNWCNDCRVWPASTENQPPFWE